MMQVEIHVTPHTSHLTLHTSHLNTSHFTRQVASDLEFHDAMIAEREQGIQEVEKVGPAQRCFASTANAMCMRCVR